MNRTNKMYSIGREEETRVSLAHEADLQRDVEETRTGKVVDSSPDCWRIRHSCAGSSAMYMNNYLALLAMWQISNEAPEPQCCLQICSTCC